MHASHILTSELNYRFGSGHSELRRTLVSSYYYSGAGRASTLSLHDGHDMSDDGVDPLDRYIVESAARASTSRVHS